jgi:hypothetical protein
MNTGDINMGKMGKRGYFGKHAKSSAAAASLAIHAILIVAALSFVAVRVIVKDDQTFEAQKINRPRMKLKKLTVPVNIKKKKIQKPKLRKTIVSKPKTRSLDIKMPEISGVMCLNAGCEREGVGAKLFRSGWYAAHG